MTKHVFDNAVAADVRDMQATALAQQVGDAQQPGYYYVPDATAHLPRIVQFDGKAWHLPGDNEKVIDSAQLGEVGFGPVEFQPSYAVLESVWPEPGDEFHVFVEVREQGGRLAGFILHPTSKLAELLRNYGDSEFTMVEELFGQDFLPDTPGLYRMHLRMYVDPAYQIDDHEWSDDEPGLEVLSVERLTAEPMPLPTSTA
jgi:hypothetical protein